MLPIAVTALEAMKDIPPHVWLEIGIGVAIVVITLVVIPKIFKMNKLILGIIVFVASTIIFFSWIKQRNEPKFLTPLIDHIVPFFSSDVVRDKAQKKLPK